MPELKAIVKKLYYTSDRFSAGVLETPTGDVRFSGPFPIGEGDKIIAEGNYFVDKKYGKSFKVEKFSYDTKLDAEGLIEVIAKSKSIVGVGPAKARKFVSALKDIEEVFGLTPEELHKKTGLAREACQSIQDELKFKRLHTQILAKLQGYNITFNTVNKLVEKYGPATLEILQTNPYQIIGQVPGFAFKKCDEIALKLGVAKGDPHRIRSCILYLLREKQNEGDSYQESKSLLEEANTYLHIDTLNSRDLIKDQVKELLKTQEITLFKGNLCLPDVYEKELWLSNYFKDVKKNELLSHVNETELYTRAPFISLNEGQREALANFIKYNKLVLTGGAGVGKAQPLDAIICTPDGWTTFKDIKVGDIVCTPDGKTAKVIQTHPQGIKEVYKVYFSDKTSTECTLEHLWYTKNTKERKKHIEGKIRDTKEIMESLNTRNNTRRYNHSIPMSKPINFIEYENFYISPYLMGLLLGDGGLTNGVNLTNVDEEIIEHLYKEVGNKGRISVYEYNKDTYHIRSNETGKRCNTYINEIDKLGLLGTTSETKFIPEIYKYSSKDSRIALLQGLIDSDGYVIKNNIEYSTVSKQLMEGVKFLVQSLGGHVSYSEVRKTFTHKGKKGIGKLTYRMLLKIPGDIIPCRLSRKIAKYIPKTKYSPKRYIDKIEYVGEKECKCITLDSVDGLYITNDFIVTHNSFLTNSILKLCSENGLSTILCSPTGKAAKRLEHYTGHIAHTIHRLLGYKGAEFALDNPVLRTGNVFIVDEVSMCGVDLLFHLLSNIPPNCLVVLIGDANQLPSVDYGNVLHDVLSHYPTPKTRLTACLRQAGELKENCNKILEGKVEKTSKMFLGDTKKKPWYKITSFGTPEEIQGYVEEIYSKSIKEKFDYNILTDVQLLTPTHKGPLGTVELNKIIQTVAQRTLYNREIIQTEGKKPKFYPGDKIINKKNNYNKNIMNGSIGIIKTIIDATHMVIRFDDLDIELANDELENILLAYALTVHSYQGDQVKMALVICHKSHCFQHNRNLIYTACTRAQQSCAIIGDQWAITNSVRFFGNYNRNSLLPLMK